MRLFRLTLIGQNALVTTAQVQAYYDGLVQRFGLDAVGPPVMRAGAHGRMATALFNDSMFSLCTWQGRFFVNALLLRDSIDKKQLEDFTRTTFALTSFKALLDDMGEYGTQ